MSFEAWAYNEKEKKKKELEKKEITDFEKKQFEQQKTKEYIEAETQTEDNLHKLHELVDQGLLTQQQAEHIADWDELTTDEVQEIFDKIDEIEDIKDVDKYLPAELRITKEDYSKAMIDDVFRVQIINKLDSSLSVIWQQILPNSSSWVNLFLWLLSVLDNNLIILQENTVDIKLNLDEIDKKMYPKKDLNIWKSFLRFIKLL